MKTLKRTGQSIIAALAIVVMAAMNTVKAQPGMSVSFQLFYDQLAPYGEWIDDPEYGYIWLPNAGRDFQPYASRGHWVMTSYGNTWVSDYDWGWAPFHYGRWNYSDYYGWAWVPGYEWGPAWVNWRSGGGYYGWAPLGPSMGIAVNVVIPAAHWVFVPQRYIASPRIYSYYTPYRNRVNIYNRTTIINNTYVYNNRTYVTGPRHNEVERVTRSRVAIRDINSAARPGRASVNSRSVSLYRPEVDRSTRSSARPSRVADAAAVRSASTRTTTTTPAQRGTTATRSAAPRSTTPARSSSTRASQSNTRPTTPSRQATPAPRTRTERAPASRSQSAPAPRPSQRVQPKATNSNRSAVRLESVSTREKATPARAQRSSVPARSSATSSRTNARPSAASSRGSSSRSSATSSRSSARSSSSSRNSR